MLQDVEVSGAWGWIWSNREWLFSGVGLSVTLLAAGIFWKVMTGLGRVFLGISRWAAEGLSRLSVRFRNRSEPVSSRSRDEDAAPGPGGVEAPMLLTPSRHEIAVVNRARADHDMQMMGLMTGQGPYGYLQGGRKPETDNDWIKGLEGRRSVASRDVRAQYSHGRMSGRSVVARLFFLAAALNLLWVTIRALW